VRCVGPANQVFLVGDRGTTSTADYDVPRDPRALGPMFVRCQPKAASARYGQSNASGPLRKVFHCSAS